MAFENMTYEVIIKRMIDRVTSEYPTLDVREGSLIFNALAPAAIEMAIMYTELDNVLNESFVNTASREFLLIACKQIGMDVTQFEESAGTHKAVFDVEVSEGSRWNCDLYNYTVIEFLGMEENYYTYEVLCETTGTSPNNITGDLTAITEVPANLTYAKLTECLIEGENETSDDDIRTAYYDYVAETVSDGNLAQYQRWCSEYDGIGNSKIFPLWNGANTVKVSILSASNRAASTELVSDFQEYLDPNSEGMGNGVAPIGAIVTVTTATEVPITVSATVTLKEGYSDATPITTALEDYLASLAYEKTTVAYMNIGAAILSVDGVESIDNLLVNGSAANVTLGSEEIPVLGTTDWTVV